MVGIASLGHHSFAAPGRISRKWAGATVEYAWLPPFEGATLTRPNRLEVVFTGHDHVALEQGGDAFDVRVRPGSVYIVGEEPTTLKRVMEFSDTLEIYPDLDLLKQHQNATGGSSVALRPTLRREQRATFDCNLVALAVAHRFRRACLGLEHISDIEGEALTIQVLRDLVPSYGPSRLARGPGSLCGRTKANLLEFIEAHLTTRITVAALADLAGLSPFHFSRCFRAATGSSPHDYVTTRRMEYARGRILETDDAVAEVAWSMGFENLSHFRRQFVANIGVLPGALRTDTREARVATRQ